MKARKNFLIIDTEGKEYLTEIAVVDNTGALVYQAFVTDFDHPKLYSRDLITILQEFSALIEGKRLVCHYAEHDKQVLCNSFRHVDLPWSELEFECSWLLARQKYPNLSSYALDYLCRHWHLKVENKPFNANMAHGARYDALFTYQLYRFLRPTAMTTQNPFGNSRVDNPFQHHSDNKDVYQQQFQQLKAILGEIQQDTNHQSKGAVVIGSAGSGKTHLMMRLANELLSHHRLLFIRQPNNPNAVLYHVYSRILESFVETVPDSEYSQLEFLLAKSFSAIVTTILQKKAKRSKKDDEILDAISQDALNIYKRLGAESSEKKRLNWRILEKLTLDWWTKEYGFSGYASEIVRGLIKFCSYSEPHRRDWVRRWLAGNHLDEDELQKIDLKDWGSDLSQEAFALEAIEVFGRLSIVDQPLIIIFDQLEGLQYNEPLLFNFGEMVKELFTHIPNSLIIINLFPDRWAHFQTFFDASIIDRVAQYVVTLERPDDAALLNILQLKAAEHGVNIDELFNPDTLAIIVNQPSIRSVLNTAAAHFRHQADGVPLPTDPLSFEQEMRQAVAELRAEVKQLKQALQTSAVSIESVDVVQNPTVLPVVTLPTAPIQEPTQDMLIRDYLSAQQSVLERDYDRKVIISETDDIGKLLTIAQAMQTIEDLQLDCLRLAKRKLPEHLLIKTTTQAKVIAFLHASGNSFTNRLKNFNELVISHREIAFRVLRDQREPEIKSKIGKAEIEKLNNADNAAFTYFNKPQRVVFELLYKLVVDIQNKDFEVDLVQALRIARRELSDTWLVRVLGAEQGESG